MNAVRVETENQIRSARITERPVYRPGYSPKQVDGTWWEYDDVSQQYVDTGISVTGPQGDPGDDYFLTEADKAEIAWILEPTLRTMIEDALGVIENGAY